MADTQMDPPPETEGGHERREEWAERVKERRERLARKAAEEES